MLQISAFVLAFLLCLSILIMWIPGIFNPNLFQAGLFLTLVAWALRMVYRPFQVAISFPLLALALTPAWGLLQLAVHSTVSRWETTLASLTWSGNLAAFFLAFQICQSARIRKRLLKVLVIFAFLITIISVLQYFSMPDKVLWIYNDGFGETFGPFESRDRYAMFAELIIPLALSLALEKKSPLFYYAIAATLFAAVIGGASRAGSILCVAEILVFWLLVRRRGAVGNVKTNALVFALMAATFTLVVGFTYLTQRFHDPDPYAGRREFLISSLAMVRERPWLGFGLGNFQNAYPSHSVLDLNKFVEHTHNDWAEWGVDGGIPFFLILVSVMIWTLPRAFRFPWGIGILALFAHGLVDFPFQTRVLEFWVFALLGSLAAESPR
jgi:O-antigen ligase